MFSFPIMALFCNLASTENRVQKSVSSSSIAAAPIDICETYRGHDDG